MTLDSFLIAHGSALILPLTVLEGPFVSVATGFLCAQGYFDWLWVLCLLVVGDVIGDVMYYWIGRSGKPGLDVLLRRLGVRHTVTPALQRQLRDNATKMLLVGKWTQAIGAVVLIGSGMLRLPLAKFILVNLIGSLPKSAVLFSIGYFVGEHHDVFEGHGLLATSALGILGVAAIVLVLRRAGGIGVGR